jgi:hypothetical protein
VVYLSDNAYFRTIELEAENKILHDSVTISDDWSISRLTKEKAFF